MTLPTTNPSSRPLKFAELAAELARLFGDDEPYRTQTLRNYARRGMPHEVHEGKFFGEPAACRDWIAANVRAHRTSSQHGGKRRRAGRKPDTDTQTLTIATTEAARAADVRRELAERSRPPGAAVSIYDLLHVTQAELRALAANAELCQLAPAHLDVLHSFQRAQANEIQLAEKRGQLIDATEAADEWSRTLLDFRRLIESALRDLPDAILAACGLDDEHRAAIAEEVQQMQDRIFESMQGTA